MLRLTRKLTLAVEAVVDIACHGIDGPVQSQDIAGRLALPKRYLEQVMQQLVRSGILKGVRGPRGGYRLAREPARITVGDVFRAVRTGDDEEDRVSFGSASLLGQEIMAPFWASVENDLMRRLDIVSIDGLVHNTRARLIDRLEIAAAEAAD